MPSQLVDSFLFPPPSSAPLFFPLLPSQISPIQTSKLPANILLVYNVSVCTNPSNNPLCQYVLRLISPCTDVMLTSINRSDPCRNSARTFVSCNVYYPQLYHASFLPLLGRSPPWYDLLYNSVGSVAFFLENKQNTNCYLCLFVSAPSLSRSNAVYEVSQTSLDLLAARSRKPVGGTCFDFRGFLPLANFLLDRPVLWAGRANHRFPSVAGAGPFPSPPLFGPLWGVPPFVQALCHVKLCAEQPP